jgi:hypothetical protein
VLPVVEAGLAQMVDGDEALDEHLALERAQAIRRARCW